MTPRTSLWRRVLSRRALLLGALGAPLAASSPIFAQDSHAPARAELLREIDAQMRELENVIGRSGLSPRVRAALERVPRHRFVPPELERIAYRNHPLPIGHGQTISQPFIVALMTELLEPQGEDRVLEVGTGSGYQAAVLAECVARVYTIEIVAPLGERARALLAELGYRNVEVRIGDGYAGWPEAAPFDGIMVTAAPDHVPPALVGQLKPGGRMVIPVGTRGGVQELLLIRKDDGGKAVTRRTIPVRFVPLIRKK
ncbi:MAG TPA: protein-L-isoaspartate(D-aspartate) O-methyltransferase [Burkholderiaceae bacterium]|nr:protein-L-isoaspartate(D-aspartate) O-methyltransferase [Burkholderiaceae bacterium]